MVLVRPNENFELFLTKIEIKGYTGVGSFCEDFDECLNEKDGQRQLCPQGLTCLNTEGSYECLCSEGYEGLPGYCTDINECSRIGLF